MIPFGGHMTSYGGHDQIEPVREPDAHSRPAGPVPLVRELSAGARAAADGSALGRAEGPAKPRAGRTGGGAVRGPHAALPAGSPVLRPHFAAAVPGAALGAGGGAPAACGAIAAATTS